MAQKAVRVKGHRRTFKGSSKFRVKGHRRGKPKKRSK